MGARLWQIHGAADSCQSAYSFSISISGGEPRQVTGGRSYAPARVSPQDIGMLGLYCVEWRIMSWNGCERNRSWLNLKYLVLILFGNYLLALPTVLSPGGLAVEWDTLER